MHKKAQGLSINVIIIVAIALIVLVVLVAVFTGRLGIFTGAVKTIKAFFHVLDTQYMGDILCVGLEEKGVASKRQELLQQAFDAGNKLLY